MQVLRTLSPPVKAQDLATQLEVSLRTVYRDIDSLRAAGAMIDGEAGYGYTLVEDPALPPMMFTTDEIEALVLGLREVQQIGDPVLAAAATNVLSKVSAGLPKSLQAELQHSILHAKHFEQKPDIFIDIAQLRKLTRQEMELEIDYTDAKGNNTQRTMLPLSILYMKNTLMVLSYCNLRADYRAFRVDRIQAIASTGRSFKPRRVPMLRDAIRVISQQE